MICDNCIHQKACINAYASMGYFIDETKENEYKHTILKCKEFEDKEKYQSAIEKQIPKKPLWGYTCKANNTSWRSCPVCHARQHNTNKFCSQCGQALDWSE